MASDLSPEWRSEEISAELERSLRLPERVEISLRIGFFLDEVDPVSDQPLQLFEMVLVCQVLEHGGRHRTDAGLLTVVG